MSSRIGESCVYGINVFVLDFSSSSKEEMVSLVFDAIDKLSQVDEQLKFLIDVTNCDFDKSAVNNLKGIGKQIQKYVDKSAIVGLSYHQFVLFEMYQRFTKSNMKCFNSVDKAMKYLA